MAAKSKPKEYSRAEGAALLRKQLAERKGKKIGMPSKENRKNLKDLGILVGSIVAPAVGGVVKGARAAKAAKEIISKKKPYVKVTTGTQGKNANITLKTPGAKKTGSPKTGTKARVQRVVNPRQGEAGQISTAKASAKKKATKNISVSAAAVAGYQVRKEQEKSKKKKK